MGAVCVTMLHIAEVVPVRWWAVRIKTWQPQEALYGPVWKVAPIGSVILAWEVVRPRREDNFVFARDLATGLWGRDARARF